MARLKCSVGFEDVTGVAGSWKTVLQIVAAANQMAAVCRAKITGRGTAGDAKPISFRFMRTTGDGTGTAATPEKLNNALTATVQTTAKTNFTVEPADTGDYLYPCNFHPQAGQVDDIPFDEFILKEATGLALQVKIPSGETEIQTSGHLIFEE